METIEILDHYEMLVDKTDVSSSQFKYIMYKLRLMMFNQHLEMEYQSMECEDDESRYCEFYVVQNSCIAIMNNIRKDDDMRQKCKLFLNGYCIT
jgi:hypothetical protein